MHSIGIIAEDRLRLIPVRYWKAHEFCFYLHDRVAQLLVEYEASGAHTWVSQAFQNIFNEQPNAPEKLDILQFMKEHKLVQPYKHHIVSHLVLGLTSDLLHFLYESLVCFEKRKFAVGFVLLRKPLKENLLFLCWLLADQDDFISRFEANNYQTLNGVSKERQIQLLSGAIQRLSTGDAFDAELIHNVIFSKTHTQSYEPTWQRATHLITSQGNLLKTEDYSINFIFENPALDNYYELLYSKLPWLMIFTMQVALECFAYILKANEKTLSHLIITTMGCYEALFLKGRSQPMARMLNTHLRSFLKCIHCESPLRINRNNAPIMYLTEQMPCKSCGLLSDFPLYWLFAQANVSITRPGDTAILQSGTN